MFTVEMESEASVIVTLDATAQYPDVEVAIAEDMVAIRQITDSDDSPQEHVDLIIMTPQQFHDIINAMKLPAGAYYTEERKIE